MVRQKKLLTFVMLSTFSISFSVYGLADPDAKKKCNEFFIQSLGDALNKFIDSKTISGLAKITQDTRKENKEKIKEIDSIQATLDSDLASTSYKFGRTDVTAEELASRKFAEDYEDFQPVAESLCAYLNKAMKGSVNKMSHDECLVMSVQREMAKRRLTQDQKIKLNPDPVTQILELSDSFESIKFDIIASALEKTDANSECRNLLDEGDPCYGDILNKIQSGTSLQDIASNFCEILQSSKDLNEQSRNFLQKSCENINEDNKQENVDTSGDKFKHEEVELLKRISSASSSRAESDSSVNSGSVESIDYRRGGIDSEQFKRDPSKKVDYSAVLQQIEIKDERGALQKGINSITDGITGVFGKKKPEEEKFKLAERNILALSGEVAVEILKIKAKSQGGPMDPAEVEKLKNLAKRVMPNLKYFLIAAQDEKHPSNKKAKDTIKIFLGAIKSIVGLVNAGQSLGKAVQDKFSKSGKLEMNSGVSSSDNSSKSNLDVKIPTMEEILSYDFEKIEQELIKVLDDVNPTHF